MNSCNKIVCYVERNSYMKKYIAMALFAGVSHASHLNDSFNDAFKKNLLYLYTLILKLFFHQYQAFS